MLLLLLLLLLLCTGKYRVRAVPPAFPVRTHNARPVALERSMLAVLPLLPLLLPSAILLLLLLLLIGCRAYVQLRLTVAALAISTCAVNNCSNASCCPLLLLLSWLASNGIGNTGHKQ
jgi:hypothetical protein